MSNSRSVSPMSETREVREVSAAGDGDGLLRSRWRPHIANRCQVKASVPVSFFGN